MNTQPTLSPAPPWHITVDHKWYSASDFAKQWNRSIDTIQRWCKDGTLLAFHCKVYKDFRGRWWIGVPGN